jgi:L-iditol 2-dehydrogenase
MKAFFTKAPMQFKQRDVDIAPLAHELSGIVSEIGAAVTTCKIGDPVVVENSTYCGVCDQCKSGNVAHCVSLDHHRSPGGFAEHIKVRYTALYPLGDLSFSAAALAEPLTVAIDMVESAEIPLAGSVAIFGPGPIGLMIARLALYRGASRVYLTGNAHSRARWELARKIGVTDCIFADQTDVVTYFAEKEPKGLDRVLVTAPPSTIPQATQICRFGGIVAYNGIKFGGPEKIELDGNAFHFNRLQLRGVHSVPNLGWPQALELLSTKVIDPDLFVSHTYPFDQVPEAVRFSAEARSETVKVMVDFDA